MSAFSLEYVHISFGALTRDAPAGIFTFEGDFNLTNVGAITVEVATVAASGGSITITFDVTVD